MADDFCCSGGRCRPPLPPELTRRNFIRSMAVGAAGIAVSPELLGAAPPSALAPPRPGDLPRYPVTPPRVYRGANLEAVAMPIGGIGTGTVWLDGQGRLSVWQIFNNLNETRIPNGFFAVRVRSGNAAPVLRVLQTVPEEPIQPLQSIVFEGGYPIARLDFSDPALPVELRLEAFNPFIPTDAAHSSLPCALFRLTARNPGAAPVDLTLIAACQNAIGSGGDPGVRENRFPGYGRNRNRVVRDPGLVAVAMEKAIDPLPSCPVKVRARTGEIVASPERRWFAALPNLTQPAAEAWIRIAEQGGTVVIGSAPPSFFDSLALLRGKPEDLQRAFTVFADFEQDRYEGWTVSGQGFGAKPSAGTHPNQQKVTGFLGRGLVNTYLPGDASQGTLASKPFVIRHAYIGFLIGGGPHRNQTCMNLRVGGKVVRTATGKEVERLEPASWDVSDLQGREAVLEIVDRRSDAWGHIDIDHIIFSDVAPEAVLAAHSAVGAAARLIDLPIAGAETTPLEPAFLPSLKDAADPWRVARYTRLRGFRDGDSGCRALVSAPNGDPLIIAAPLGKGRIVIALGDALPWSWATSLFLSEGKPLESGQRLSPHVPGFGTMTLAAFEPDAIAKPRWTSRDELLPGLEPGVDSGESPDGETYNAALGVPFTLGPGQQRTVTFSLAWHFPHVERFDHPGNLYGRRWPDALAVTRHVAARADALWQRTRLYHETFYQSNLPEEFLDAMSSQLAILRGPTCWWSEDGYFAGFEGSYGCCPLNCTHVWNYAQSHARLFPEIGRNLRVSDLVTHLHPDGETSHRQHSPHGAFIDGHCAVIEAALREHQLSTGRAFLDRIWPGLQRATDWMIEQFDAGRDGVPSGKQWNTYDTAMSGANTFIGAQYLSALAAAERLALAMGDASSAARWRAVLEAGKKNQNAALWNGEYYIQIPGATPDRDYNNGCLSDQLLGQWWAHQLGLGYLYPPDRVRRAMESVFRYNFRRNFAGFRQMPRRYVIDSDGGLLICTWPKQDRPEPFVLYADEVWTGIEYAAAGLMVFEGLIEPARHIVRIARNRYDGRRRDGLNSGPGGNPFNELECGKFYARALSGWSLLIACQGQLLDGPAGLLGFKPRWQPADHRSFFTAPEGWGLFIQQRDGAVQRERIEVRHGRLRLRTLVFELPDAAGDPEAVVRLGAKAVPAAAHRSGLEIRLDLPETLEVAEGQAVEVECRPRPDLSA